MTFEVSSGFVGKGLLDNAKANDDPSESLKIIHLELFGIETIGSLAGLQPRLHIFHKDLSSGFRYSSVSDH